MPKRIYSLQPACPKRGSSACWSCVSLRRPGEPSPVLHESWRGVYRAGKLRGATSRRELRLANWDGPGDQEASATFDRLGCLRPAVNDHVITKCSRAAALDRGAAGRSRPPPAPHDCPPDGQQAYGRWARTDGIFFTPHRPVLNQEGPLSRPGLALTRRGRHEAARYGRTATRWSNPTPERWRAP